MPLAPPAGSDRRARPSRPASPVGYLLDNSIPDPGNRLPLRARDHHRAGARASATSSAARSRSTSCSRPPGSACPRALLARMGWNVAWTPWSAAFPCWAISSTRGTRPTCGTSPCCERARRAAGHSRQASRRFMRGPRRVACWCSCRRGRGRRRRAAGAAAPRPASPVSGASASLATASRSSSRTSAGGRVLPRPASPPGHQAGLVRRGVPRGPHPPRAFTRRCMRTPRSWSAGTPGSLCYVPDLLHYCGELHDRGVRFVAEPTQQSWGIMAMVADPDGNILALWEDRLAETRSTSAAPVGQADGRLRRAVSCADARSRRAARARLAPRYRLRLRAGWRPAVLRADRQRAPDAHRAGPALPRPRPRAPRPSDTRSFSTTCGTAGRSSPVEDGACSPSRRTSRISRRYAGISRSSGSCRSATPTLASWWCSTRWTIRTGWSALCSWARYRESSDTDIPRASRTATRFRSSTRRRRRGSTRWSDPAGRGPSAGVLRGERQVFAGAAGRPPRERAASSWTPATCRTSGPANLARHFEHHFGAVQRLDVPREAVMKVRVPVLTIHGTWDRNAPYAAGREWALTLPNARLLTIEGAAHQLTPDAPDIVLPAIDDFVDGRWPDGAERVTSAGAHTEYRAEAPRCPERVLHDLRLLLHAVRLEGLRRPRADRHRGWSRPRACGGAVPQLRRRATGDSSARGPRPDTGAQWVSSWASTREVALAASRQEDVVAQRDGPAPAEPQHQAPQQPAARSQAPMPIEPHPAPVDRQRQPAMAARSSAGASSRDARPALTCPGTLRPAPAIRCGRIRS